MNSRLLDIIRYKTGGKQSEFAALLGWTPQYLAKLLRGENFGIITPKNCWIGMRTKPFPAIWHCLLSATRR